MGNKLEKAPSPRKSIKSNYSSKASPDHADSPPHVAFKHRARLARAESSGSKYSDLLAHTPKTMTKIHHTPLRSIKVQSALQKKCLQLPAQLAPASLQSPICENSVVIENIDKEIEQ